MKQLKNLFLSLCCILICCLQGQLVVAAEDKTYYADPTVNIRFDEETIPSIVYVNQEGQVRRAKDDPYYSLQHSLSFRFYDENILSIDEKGQWKALRAGTTTVDIYPPNPGDKPSLRAEMNEQGFIMPADAAEPPLVRPINAVNRWTVTVVDPSSHKPMYRLYNPNNLEHFYTSDVNEKDALVKIGWGHYEGVAWQAPAIGKPVYRLYNPILKDHHYTSNRHEVDTLVAHYNWKEEGIAWYSDGTKVIYRLFHPGLTSGSHHYTSDQNEVAVLQERGWKYEGPAWNGY